MEIAIRAFKAISDEETCLKFIDGHRRLLEFHFGVAKITSSNNSWMHHENTYVVVAESLDRSKVFGGARVQVADGKLPLPIEAAVGKYDPKIHEQATPGSSEICGLWNSREVAGMGIGSIFMARVGVVMAMQLNVEKIFFLCAPVTVRIGRRIGGLIETTLGNKGEFFYPKDDFVATAMVINDCQTLVSADEKERAKIFELFDNPIQQRVVETGPKGDMLVDYLLKI
ncbi:hypothetical protein ABDK00_017305 [Niabella insulamsoli]|uniref:hypothetical protein n=1 Tax=Niabella insulamsoli TaxID=3144874 RepID=UPI0031FE0E8E